MVYHNLSMSLNHHVPIFICTVTKWGGSLLFAHTWGALTVKVSLSHRGHFCTTIIHRLMALVGSIHVRFNPTPLVWRHLFWVLWPCFISTGHFGFDCISSIPLCTLQMLYIKAIYNKGKNMNTLHILAFLNMEETQPWSSNIFPLFLKTRCIYLHFLWSEINPLSISHECKD